MTEDIPKDLSDTTRIDPSKSVGTHDDASKNAENFKSYMNQGEKAGPQQTETTQKPSPMDLQKTISSPSTPPSPTQVQEQMNSTSSRLGDIKSKLHTKNLKLKQSDKYLIRNKLSSANEKLRQVAEKTGAKSASKSLSLGSKNPIEKFLALVSDGQEQMESAARQMASLGKSGKQINAGDLLYIQTKLQKATQELDFTSMLLGKSIDAIKTVFNIQI